jgi:hypothetical protein
MRKKAIVYIHKRNDTNEIFYVGIGKTKKRAYSTHNRNKHWYNVVSKCGYSVEIYDEFDDYELAKLREIELISVYGRKDLGEGNLVNMTDGGEGARNRKFSAEVKRKLKENHPDFSGVLNPMYNKHHTEETKLQISNSIKQWLTNNVHYWKDKTHSEETKAKMSNNQQGKSNSFYCKKHSEETKAKMREARKKNNNG